MSNPLTIAVELIKEVGELQLELLHKDHDIEFKGETNIVTDVDKKCEKIIFDRIRKEFPKHDILAEEGGNYKCDSSWKWIVDPLDGTVNYSHRYPLFGTSIALEYKGDLVVGVVSLPKLNEIYIAEKGSGTALNDNKVSVSKQTDMRQTLLSTGFAYNIFEGEGVENIQHFRNFIFRSQAVRRDGMAAGDLCFVACGRYDGLWQLHLKPWDIAAGTLIVEEAGGRVTDFKGNKIDIYGEEITATNGYIHEDFLKVLNIKG